MVVAECLFLEMTGFPVIFSRHNRNSLKILGTVGEPINPEAWLWYRNVVGKKQCPVVDTYWQTETVRESIDS